MEILLISLLVCHMLLCPSTATQNATSPCISLTTILYFHQQILMTQQICVRCVNDSPLDSRTAGSPVLLDAYAFGSPWPLWFDPLVLSSFFLFLSWHKFPLDYCCDYSWLYFSTEFYTYDLCLAQFMLLVYKLLLEISLLLFVTFVKVHKIVQWILDVELSR